MSVVEASAVTPCNACNALSYISHKKVSPFSPSLPLLFFPSFLLTRGNRWETHRQRERENETKRQHGHEKKKKKKKKGTRGSKMERTLGIKVVHIKYETKSTSNE